MSKKIQWPQLSTEARISLIEQGKDKVRIYGKFPIDPENCECKPLIKATVQTAHNIRKTPQYTECPRRFTKGMKRYKVVCKNCGEILAFFYNTHPKLDSNYCDLHYFTWFDKDGKRGCSTVNYNPNTGKVNFECHCGYRAIREPRATFRDIEFVKTPVGEKVIRGRNMPVKNWKRYTDYKILLAETKDGDK